MSLVLRRLTNNELVNRFRDSDDEVVKELCQRLETEMAVCDAVFEAFPRKKEAAAAPKPPDVVRYAKEHGTSTYEARAALKAAKAQQ